MDNINNSTNSFNLQRQPSEQTTHKSQRPLIDVARTYCNNLHLSSSNTSRIRPLLPHKCEMKENKSYSSTSMPNLGYSAYPNQRNPYTWKAKPDVQLSSTSSHVAAESFSKPKNLYSWKASSRMPDTPLSSTENTTKPFPRPPKMSLPKHSPKLEPLTVTVSVSKDSDSCVANDTPQQSPLQPFSPIGISRECSCLRSPKVILCQSCGLIQKGRLSLACAIHPRQVFLMDLNCCSGCKSTNLKEICDAKK